MKIEYLVRIIEDIINEDKREEADKMLSIHKVVSILDDFERIEEKIRDLKSIERKGFLRFAFGKLKEEVENIQSVIEELEKELEPVKWIKK